MIQDDKPSNNKLTNKNKVNNKLEKVLNLSDELLIANAISTLLKKDNLNKH